VAPVVERQRNVHRRVIYLRSFEPTSSCRKSMKCLIVTFLVPVPMLMRSSHASFHRLGRAIRGQPGQVS
jgi:hypothetical protein